MISAAVRRSDPELAAWRRVLGRGADNGAVVDRANFQKGLRLPPKALNDSVCQVANAESLKSSHSSSPSSRATEDGANMHPTSNGPVPNIDIGHRDRVPSRRDSRDLIKLAFSNALPPHRYPAKQIAGEIGASQSTVEGWRTDRGMMSADFMMIMQVKYPQFESELRRLFKLQRELSPDFAREFTALLQRVL
jgi:hypothetical protein